MLGLEKEPIHSGVRIVDTLNKCLSPSVFNLSKNVIGENLKPSEEPEEAKICKFQREQELFLFHCIPCACNNA